MLPRGLLKCDRTEEDLDVCMEADTFQLNLPLCTWVRHSLSQVDLGHRHEWPACCTQEMVEVFLQKTTRQKKKRQQEQIYRYLFQSQVTPEASFSRADCGNWCYTLCSTQIFFSTLAKAGQTAALYFGKAADAEGWTRILVHGAFSCLSCLEFLKEEAEMKFILRPKSGEKTPQMHWLEEGWVGQDAGNQHSVL